MKKCFRNCIPAIPVAGIVFCSALLGFALMTVRKVDENRAYWDAQFQDYGTPIQVSGNLDLGVPAEIVLTPSAMEYSKWSRIQSAISEYVEASGDVVGDLFRRS